MEILYNKQIIFNIHEFYKIYIINFQFNTFFDFNS